MILQKQKPRFFRPGSFYIPYKTKSRKNVRTFSRLLAITHDNNSTNWQRLQSPYFPIFFFMNAISVCEWLPIGDHIPYGKI